MAPGDRSAYPRFPSTLSAHDLTTRYTPSPEEIQWCQSIARDTPLQHAALVFLKCFQQLHYFPEPSDIPDEILRHIAEIIGFERLGPFDLSSATRYRQQAAIRRYLGVTPFYLCENNLAVGYHFRYREMGLVAYRHVADNYIAVFRHFIPPGIWEAVYVIEGLLKAGLSVEPDTVYSDTQGQSTTVFAFTYLLGIQLMPRIRNWKDLTFHRPDTTVHYQHIDSLFGGAIAWKLIEAHWPELMQVAVSIQAGKINSATLLRKLSYGGPRNKLFLAAQELGRAVRTIFLLKWISQAELRRDVTANTNKIEAYNGFAKWLSFGGDVVATNDPHEQQKRLCYNDLIAACVILQNTVDMTRMLRKREVEHKPVQRSDLAFLSPYGTQHVKRFGEYSLDLARDPEPWLAEPTFREAVQQVRRQTAVPVLSST